MSKQVLAALAALAIVTASCSTVGAAPPVAPSGSLPTDAALGEGEQRHEAGAVTVSASWIAGTPSAGVALDTHSVDLDGFDLKTLARVRLDGGAWVAPSAWDAPQGGHHRSGTLSFDTLDAQAFASARVIELEIRDVGAPSHLLRWERAR